MKENGQLSRIKDLFYNGILEFMPQAPLQRLQKIETVGILTHIGLKGPKYVSEPCGGNPT